MVVARRNRAETLAEDVGRIHEEEEEEEEMEMERKRRSRLGDGSTLYRREEG